jgi:ketosteroid isomerase-like protein
MLRTCCCIVLALFSLAQARAQKTLDDSQENKLLVMEHLWNQAQLSGDAQALDGMIGANFIDTEYDGEVSDKSKFLADVKDPQFKPASISIQDLKVNRYGDSAVVAGSYHIKGQYQGKSYDHLGRFTDTWVYMDGRWQCVASHSSLLKK